jgi:hypothetical protein
MKNRVVREDRLSIATAMLMCAGATLGFWLVTPDLRDPRRGPFGFGYWDEAISLGSAYGLGGLSFLGPPLLLWRVRGRPWGPGRMLWFACGLATWIFWPSYIFARANWGATLLANYCAQLFFTATPLIAILILSSFWAGGWFYSTRRRRLRLSWQETFGIVLGVAWSCLGLHRLAWLYYTDIFSH